MASSFLLLSVRACVGCVRVRLSGGNKRDGIVLPIVCANGPPCDEAFPFAISLAMAGVVEIYMLKGVAVR